MQRRGQAREHAILAATLDVLGDRGYERMTMDAVAAREVSDTAACAATCAATCPAPCGRRRRG